MATLTIEGKKVKVDDAFLSLSPEEQSRTVDEIAAQIGISAPAIESSESAALREDLSRKSNDFFKPQSNPTDSFVRGAADTMTFGLADEAAALGARYNPVNPENYSSLSRAADTISNLNPITGAINTVRQLVSPDEQMQSELQRERAIQGARDEADPAASTTGRIAGALTSAAGLMKAQAPYMAALPADASLAAKSVQGARAGALYSGLYGLGSGEDIPGRITEGVEQAAVGGLIGGAVPGVTEGVKAFFKPLKDAYTGYTRPAAFANQKIAERLADANLDPSLAASKMATQPGVTLADVGGKSTRNLLRTATNIPGKAEDIVVSRLNKRQWGQGDRIKDIIRETFADPEVFEAAKGKLFKLQEETSKPLYEKALSKKNVWNNRLDMFLRDPVTQSGIKQGIRIQRLEALAENVPFDPKDYAIVAFNEAGDPIIGGVPNMRTVNVIKKGLDAMLEGARHPITGRLTEEGRAIDGVRRAFLNEVDLVNPDYKVARQNYANFMQVNDAMEFGRKALSMSPASVKAKAAEMTPMERIAARVGAAESMRKLIDEAGWNNNAILKVFSSRQKVGNLRALYRSDEEFAEARKMVFAEMRKRATYDTVKGNSTSVKQAADLADAGGLVEGVEAAKDLATGRIGGTLRYIGSRMKMLGGFTPEVAEDVARKLMATDPATVKRFTGELMKIDAQRISDDQKRQLVQRLITPMIAAPSLELRQRSAQ